MKTLKVTALTTLFMLMTMAAWAQMSNVNKADKALSEGDLATAKELIDLAAVNEKSAKKSRTWFLKARIYGQIATSDNPDENSLSDNALNECLDAYKKVFEMEKEGSVTRGQADIERLNLGNTYLNKGAQAYQNNDYEQAYENFGNLVKVRPADTTGYLYAGFAARSGEMYDKTLEKFYALINDLGYTGNADVYRIIISIEKSINEDNEKALEVAQAARKAHPNNSNIQKDEINLLILTGKVDEARGELERAIQAEPDNPNLYFNLGVMYEETGERDKSIDSYEKAIAIDNDYFDAIYNLAVIYYNAAADLLNKAGNTDDMKEYDTFKRQAKDELALAMPHMENASRLRPEEPILLENLARIYQELNMPAKAEEALNKADALRGQ